MPSQPDRATHGTRSHRSTGRRRIRRLFSGLLVVLLVLSIPSTALGSFVYLDPGHGGRYPGAVYGGVTEAYVNLMLSLEIRRALQARGHRVGMTRTSNSTVGPGSRPAWHWDDDGVYLRYCDSSCDHDAPIHDLQARVDKANEAGAEVFISIHNNAGSTAARGSETYTNWDNQTDLQLSARLADLIQSEVVAHAGTRDRGTHEIGFYVVRWSNMPAVLVEVGFLSNSSDRALLLSPSFRRRVAAGVADAVDRFIASEPFQPLYPRIAGETRYGTAAQIATTRWPDGAETVYLASGLNWPDSLAATPLAVEDDAPILLSRPDALPVETADALRDLDPSRVLLLGGTEPLSSRVATQAADAAGIPAGDVVRLAGANRYETATQIASRIETQSGEVFLVSGADFPDALSASARAGTTGSPILMTTPAGLSTPTRAYLEANADEIDRVYVLGGTSAVSDAAASAAGDAAEASVTRVWGRTRYETNLAALKRFWPNGDVSPLVARATDFPDALVAGVIAAQDGQPIMLTGTRYLPARTREFLMNEEERVAGFTMIGGEQAVSILMEWQFVKAMRRDR
jgi:N-acetylmuramoyl-L-alanine amidase/putative cell wall-binding protein